jgi:hypothetical protein
MAAEPRPEAQPDTLPLSAIWQFPTVFQPRHSMLDERHIQDLVRALKQRSKLDPVLVMQVGPEVVLIDGHHRLAAYRLAKLVDAVPVSYFGCTINDAVLEAGRANSKAKLPMSTRERMNYAWRLVLMDGYSKSQISEAAAISDGQVATMRRTKRTLGDEAIDCPTWWHALAAAKGREFAPMSDEEEEQWMEVLANTYADRLSKAFDTKLSNNPEIAAKAFEIYFGRRIGELARELQEHASEEDEEDEEFDF